MSNVVSPRGPLPPRIYWRRRLVLLAVVMGLVLLVGRLFSGGDDGADAEAVADRGPAAPAAGSQGSRPGASSDAPNTGDADPENPETSDDAANHGAPARKPETSRPGQARVARADAASTALRGPTGPLAQPAGTCDASEVAIVPDVEDTDASGPVPIRLGLSALGDKACTFSFDADDVALRVTSGDDLIWESLKCPEAIEEQSVVVRPGWLTYLTVTWSGRRGDACAQAGQFAEPGYYWAEAASLGGEPERSQFELETPPPPPKPDPKQKQQDADADSGADSAGSAADSADSGDSGDSGDSADRRDAQTAPTEKSPADRRSRTDGQRRTPREDRRR